MPKSKVIFASLAGIVIVVGSAMLLHHKANSDADRQQWQARAEATADDPKAARQVILDSIYAGKTFMVAQCYEETLQHKPLRQARIANFAHAVEVANRYCDEEILKIPDGDTRFFHMEDHATASIKSIVLPPENITLHTEVQMEEAREFKPTRIADAWLAWAALNGSHYEDYQQALKMDPKFGEAYYDMATYGALSQSGLPLPTQHRLAVHYLNLAEQLEPKLHPLVTSDRYLMAQKQGDKKAAIRYLREYLRV